MNFMCDRIIMENIKSANVPAIVIGVKEYGEKRDGLGGILRFGYVQTDQNMLQILKMENGRKES